MRKWIAPDAARNVVRLRLAGTGAGPFARIVCMAMLLTWFVSGANALGTGEPTLVDPARASEGDMVEVTGIVNRYGSEPHSYLAIAVPVGDAGEGGTQGDGSRTDEAGTDNDVPTVSDVRLFRLDEFEERLNALQGREVTLRGTIVSPERGPGFPATLRVTGIIEPGV